MAIDRVLKAVQDYLEEEAAILDCAPERVSPQAIAKQLERARGTLRSALKGYDTWRTRERTFRRILVAVDGSDQAGWASDVAGRMAKAFCAKVALVHVVPDPAAIGPEFVYSEPNLLALRRQEGEAFLRNAQQRLPEGLEIQPMLYEGDPARQIVSAAKDWRADLIVIGTHGRGVLGRLLLGSTAESVVRHAPCPVLTVAHSSVELGIEQLVSEEADRPGQPANRLHDKAVASDAAVESVP
jgi:nucleotide-binding universal stress UspA family protein